MDFLCANCGHVFDEDDAGVHVEVERLSGRPAASQSFLVCPRCDSGDIEPTTTDEEE